MLGGCAPSTWAADPSAGLLGKQAQRTLLPLTGSFHRWLVVSPGWPCLTSR